MYAIRPAGTEDGAAICRINEEFDVHSHPEIVERALGEGRVAEGGGGGVVGYRRIGAPAELGQDAREII